MDTRDTRTIVMTGSIVKADSWSSYAAESERAVESDECIDGTDDESLDNDDEKLDCNEDKGAGADIEIDHQSDADDPDDENEEDVDNDDDDEDEDDVDDDDDPDDAGEEDVIESKNKGHKSVECGTEVADEDEESESGRDDDEEEDVAENKEHDTKVEYESEFINEDEEFESDDDDDDDDDDECDVDSESVSNDSNDDDEESEVDSDTDSGSNRPHSAVSSVVDVKGEKSTVPKDQSQSDSSALKCDDANVQGHADNIAMSPAEIVSQDTTLKEYVACAGCSENNPDQYSKVPVERFEYNTERISEVGQSAASDELSQLRDSTLTLVASSEYGQALHKMKSEGATQRYLEPLVRSRVEEFEGVINSVAPVTTVAENGIAMARPTSSNEKYQDRVWSEQRNNSKNHENFRSETVALPANYELVQQLNLRIAELSRLCNDISNENKSLRSFMQDERNSLQETVRKELEAVHSTSKELKESVDGIHNGMQITERRLTYTENNYFKEQVDQAQNQLSDLKTEVKNLNEIILDQKKTETALQNEIETGRTDKSLLEIKIAELQESITSSVKKTQLAEEVTACTERANAELKDRIDILLERCNALEAGYKVEIENEALKSAIKIASLERSLFEMEQNLSDSEQKSKLADDLIACADRENAELKVQNSSLLERIRSLETDIKSETESHSREIDNLKLEMVEKETQFRNEVSRLSAAHELQVSDRSQLETKSVLHEIAHAMSLDVANPAMTEKHNLVTQIIQEISRWRSEPRSDRSLGREPPSIIEGAVSHVAHSIFESEFMAAGLSKIAGLLGIDESDSNLFSKLVSPVTEKVSDMSSRLKELEEKYAEAEAFIAELLDTIKRLTEERSAAAAESTRVRAVCRRLSTVIKDSASVVGRKRINSLINGSVPPSAF